MMAEKWEEELEILLAKEGILYGDTIEIPPWSTVKSIPDSPDWCDQDSFVSNYIISELYRRVKLTEERSEVIPLGDRLRAYLQVRGQVIDEYVKPLFSFVDIRIELSIEQGTIRYTKPLF